MAAVESFISVFGSFASLIGLSFQLYDKAKAGVTSRDDERLGLFVALTDVSKTWKSIHNDYHMLAPNIRDLAKNLSDGRGGVKSASQISDADLLALFRSSTQIVQQARNFRARLEVYFSEPRTRTVRNPAEISTAVSAIRSAIDLNVALAASKVHQAQSSAITAHDSVCDFFDIISPLLRKSGWKPDEKELVLDKFLNLPNDFDSVILDCDVVLLNVIDLYEYISKDLLEM